MYSLAIYNLFGTIYIGNEIFIAKAALLYQINFTVEYHFKGIPEAEIIVYIVKLSKIIHRLKVNQQIHVTIIIEPISEYGAKHSETFHFMELTKLKDTMQI